MITSEEQLRSLYAMPAERALLKQQVDLDRHCLRFIALSPLCIVATGGGAGAMMDASPRGGKPGFIKAPDNQTLLIPDSGGNNRLDSFSNLIADPRIGLIAQGDLGHDLFGCRVFHPHPRRRMRRDPLAVDIEFIHIFRDHNNLT